MQVAAVADIFSGPVKRVKRLRLASIDDPLDKRAIRGGQIVRLGSLKCLVVHGRGQPPCAAIDQKPGAVPGAYGCRLLVG